MLSSSILRSARGAAFSHRAPTLFLRGSRSLSTLPDNEHIYVFKHPLDPTRSLLTLLPTDPPNVELSLGTSTSNPPTTSSFTENPAFRPILHTVLGQYATQDPHVQQQAAVYASSGGFNLGGATGSNADGAGGASHQGGMGGGNRGGWVHVSDERNPPDWGRIAYPEDIFGSVGVDGEGRFVGEYGNYQDSGTYRMATRDGILGLSPFLRGKVVLRLRELERQKKDA